MVAFRKVLWREYKGCSPPSITLTTKVDIILFTSSRKEALGMSGTAIATKSLSLV